MRRTAPALLLSVLALAACGQSAADETSSAPGSPLEVTVGLYPYAFVAERVGGEDVEVTNLTSPGVEPHDLELSPQQVVQLRESDLVVYASGFQPAVDEAVEQQAEDRAFDVLGAVELLAGEHGEHEGEEHEDEDQHEGREQHVEGAADPHVWLDPMRLATIAVAVAEQMGQADPDRADAYAERAQALQVELAGLDTELREGLSSCERQQIVTSHDAFGYLAAAYGLEQVSITGLSPEETASPKRLAEVAQFAKESGVTTVFFEELVSPKVAQSLAREVGAEATVLSPLEGAPEQGDYLDAMRDNLAALRTALGCA